MEVCLVEQCTGFGVEHLGWYSGKLSSEKLSFLTYKIG